MRLGRPPVRAGRPRSAYLRLSTRPVDQAPFDRALDRLGEDELRRQVLAGGYCLDEPGGDGPVVHLAATGAVLPEVLAAAEVLAAEGARPRILNLTSADRLFRAWRHDVHRSIATSTTTVDVGHLATLFPPGTRRAPIVTVHDAAPHGLAWLGGLYGAGVIPLGVERYGQSGALADTYTWHQLDVEAIVNAGLLAIDGFNPRLSAEG